MIATDEIERLLGPSVRHVESRPSPYRTSFDLQELEVVLEEGTRLSLIAKDCSHAALSSEAAAAKPEFLRDAQREILVYEELLGGDGAWAPRLHASLIDPARDRYWLVLERVPGVELFQVGEIERWQGVARWLARMHTALTARARVAAVPLVRYDSDRYHHWAERAMAFGHPGPALRSLLGRWDEVVAQLLELPQSFIHGELYASNVLVALEGGEWRTAAVDWETSGLGPALVDLAALTSGAWTPPQREAIAAAYHDELRELDLETDLGALMRSLQLVRLHLAVQWLGWSEAWQPPAHLQHDWRSEAEALSRSVTL